MNCELIADFVHRSTSGVVLRQNLKEVGCGE